MSSAFDQDLVGAAAWDVLVSVFGETQAVTITPAGGTPTTVTAIFQRGRVLTGIFERRRPEKFGVLLVRSTAVTSWTPTEGDQVSIGSEAFMVVAYAQNPGGIFAVQISTID